LAQTFGVLKEPLRYVVRSATPPTDFISEEARRMYQFSLVGQSFALDNQAVYRKLKAYLIDSPGWAWIQPYDAGEDGRNAYLAWTAHQMITTARASSAKEPQLPRPSSITSITGANKASPLKNARR
jgi:hypothetical protein